MAAVARASRGTSIITVPAPAGPIPFPAHSRGRAPAVRGLPRGSPDGALDIIGGRLDLHADPDDRTVDRVDFMQSRGKEDPAQRDRLGGRAAGWKDQPSRYSLTSQMIAPKSGRSRLNRGARLLKKAWSSREASQTSRCSRGTVPRPGWSFRSIIGSPGARISPCGPMTLGLTYRTESGRCRADTRPGPWEGPRDEEFILGTGQDGRSWGRTAPLAIP